MGHAVVRLIDVIIRGLSYVLVPMFMIGMCGSAIVVMITVVHDLNDFFSDSGDETASHDGLS